MALDFDALVLGPTMAVFGGAVTYHPAAGIGQAGFTIEDAVFDEAYVVVDLQDGVEVTSLQPVLGVRTAHFAAHPGEPARNAQTVIPGKGTYVTRDVQLDGHGHALLFLNLMAPA